MDKTPSLSLSFALALAISAAGPADARCRRTALEAGRSEPVSLALAAPAGSRALEHELGSDDNPRPRRSPKPEAAASPAPEAGSVRPPRPPASRTGAEGARRASPPTVADLTPTVFSVAPGETLRGALTRWAGIAGWQVVWEAPNDYALSAPASFSGPFPDAVTRLLDSLQGNGAPYGAELYTGNRVVRVTRVR